MGIFNISGSETKEVDDKITDTGTEAGVAADDSTNVIDGNNEDSSKLKAKKEEAKKEAKVVLDGPLSHIYTQALNIAYAKEGLHTMLAQAMSGDDKHNHTAHGEDDSVLYYQYRSSRAQKVDGNKTNDLYLYCCDGDALDSSEIVESSNRIRLALDSKKYKNVAVAVECKGRVTNKIGLLEEFSRSIGVRVFFTRKNALESFKTALEELL